MPLSPIELAGLEKKGIGLNRPEDVVVSRDGRVWAADKASACAEILPDGSLRRVGSAGGDPNGINMDLEGRILIANFGNGELQRLDPETGEIEVLVSEVEGRRLTTSNYPIVDKAGNIWCDNSTFADQWVDALDGRADGLLYRLDPEGKLEKMADGVQFANGLALDQDESHLYVCQTTGCNVVRYPIRPDGALGEPEEYGPRLGFLTLQEACGDRDPEPADMAKLGHTDGCGFDIEGNLWVTLVTANKIVAITPESEVVTIVEDPTGALMNQPTNVSWGGPDMCDLYIGSIATNYVLHARSPVPGLPLIHQR